MANQNIDLNEAKKYFCPAPTNTPKTSPIPNTFIYWQQDERIEKDIKTKTQRC